MTTMRLGMKELRVRISRENYDSLRESAKVAGFGSLSAGVRNIIDRHLFEQLYLTGSFAKQNTKQIKELLKVIQAKKSTT